MKTTSGGSSAGTGYSTDLRFVLNGKAVTINDVSPATLLVDYLRSAEVGLTGTKIGCKQGGCGACTVLLSQYDPATQTVSHRSINACMRPLAALDGMMVTTVEGMGSVNGEVSPVQYALAKNNGTQCGYCTPGMVMSAHGCLAACGINSLKFDTTTDRVDPSDPNLPKLPTQQEIQQRFDGNICRCTGYRPILFGFEKGFAKDWTDADAAGCMTCKIDPAEDVEVSRLIAPAFPDAFKVPPRAVNYSKDGYQWFRPTSLADLQGLMAQYASATELKLVHGNTSVGVYDKYTENPHVLIDVAHVPELYAISVDEGGMKIGSGVTYNDFIAFLDTQIAAATGPHPERLAGLNALRYMAERTAGAIVRDAASLGGNTMLVLRHILNGTPFPSDMFTALMAMGVATDWWTPGSGKFRCDSMWATISLFTSTESMRTSGLLLGYYIPFTGPIEYVQVYKTALREVNSHSIVNSGFSVTYNGASVADPIIVYGGVAPSAVRFSQVEAALVGQPWTWQTYASAKAALISELDALFTQYADRFNSLPSEGFTNDYKRELAVSFLYKFFVEFALLVNPTIITPQIKSAADRVVRPVSGGTQNYNTYPDEAPINVPYVKLEAFLQATGEAVYPQDLPLPHRGLEAAYAYSTRARAAFHYAIPGGPNPASPAQVLAVLQAMFPGVVDYVTEADVPDGKNMQGSAKDQPLFAPQLMGHPWTYGVNTDGQALGLVLATHDQVALDAAHYVSTQLVAYSDETPIITIPDAVAVNNTFKDYPTHASWMSHVWQVVRPGTDSAWAVPEQPVQPVLPSQITLGGVHCQVVQTTSDPNQPGQVVGGQIHFYMETQTCLVVPGEDGQLLVRSSTQDSNQVQSGVAGVLGLPMNKVDVRIKRIGGGYGGKCNSPTFVAIAAAIAAHKHNRAVRLAVKREVDSAMFGHRHPGQANFAVAIGDGTDSPENKGKMMGLRNAFLLNGGWTYDCSFIVMDCLQLRVDSAYYVPNYYTSGDVCRTNIASNTAFRTMGLIQGVIMQEEAIERAANQIGMLPEDVRAKNLYQKGQTTPFGQVPPDCYIQEVFQFTRTTPFPGRDATTKTFDQRLADVNAFNANNRWRKRGISLIPVKYGSGFNLPMLEQAGALVEVFDSDATVLVRTGGIEMGQGLNTKIAQAAAYYLGIPLGLIRVAELDTAVVPHPTSTGASTGSSFNAEAVAACCKDLCQRLIDFCNAQNPKLPCPAAPGQPWPTGAWKSAVSAAEAARVNLSSQQRVAIAGGTQLDGQGLYFHPHTSSQTPESNYNFTGYTYSAAIAEVEVDVLTGETVVLQADIVYDMGRSQNPAVDVGQIEGAFVQGIGYVMYEELVYQPEGTPLPPGVLNSTNTWNYKPPAVTSVPLKMNVDMYPDPESDQDPLLSSKEVGEPPMTLAATVFFAIKHAVLAARQDAGQNGWFNLECPATVQRIREACLADPAPPQSQAGDCVERR